MIRFVRENVFGATLVFVFAIAGFFGARVLRAAPPPPCPALCTCKNVTAIYSYSAGTGSLFLQANGNPMVYSIWTHAPIDTISTTGGCMSGTSTPATPQVIYYIDNTAPDLCSYSYPSGYFVETEIPSFNQPTSEPPHFARRVCAP